MASRIIVFAAATIAPGTALVSTVRSSPSNLRHSRVRLHEHRGMHGEHNFDDEYVIESWRDTGSGFQPHQVVKLNECICPDGHFWDSKNQSCQKQKGIGGDCGPRDGLGLRLQVCEDGLKCSDWGLESCPEPFYLLTAEDTGRFHQGDICCNVEALDGPCGSEEFQGAGVNESWVCPRGCSVHQKNKGKEKGPPLEPFCKQDTLNLDKLLDENGEEIVKACRWQNVPASCVGCGPDDFCQTGGDRLQGTPPFEDECASWYIVQKNAQSCTHLKAFPADYFDDWAAFASVNRSSKQRRMKRKHSAYVNLRERIQGTKRKWGCVDADEGVLGKDGVEGLPDWARDGSAGGYCANYFYEPDLCSSEQDDDDFNAAKMCCACGGGEDPKMGPDEADACLGLQEGAKALGVKLPSGPGESIEELAKYARGRCEQEEGCNVEAECSAKKPVFASALGGPPAQAWWCNPKEFVRMDVFQYRALATGMLEKVTETAAGQLKDKMTKL